MSGVPRSYTSVVAPVIAVLATVGLAYAVGFGPFHDGPQAAEAEDGGTVALMCAADRPEDCEPTEENIRRSHEGAEDSGDPLPTSGTTLPAAQPDARTPLPPVVNGVRTLFDDKWLVEEGQWTLGEPPVTYDAPPGTPEPSFTAMLEAVGPDGVYITTPGFYGYYRTVVELHDRAPAVPAWCQDAAEVSLRIGGERPAFTMASFDLVGDPVTVPAGTYRVRYCTEQQDRAATQDEFTGDEYTVYAGRHLLQLWRAPRRADQVLRAQSTWARNLSR